MAGQRRRSQGATRARGQQDRMALARGLGSWVQRGLGLVALAMVGWVGWLGANALLAMPVERIAVTGKLENTQAQAVSDVVAETLRGGLVTANLDEMREALEALPWVHTAAVGRRWPDTLEIAVVEQLPIARWGDTGFLNHEAEVFSTASAEQSQDLPVIHGPDGSESRLMHDYQRLDEALVPLGLGVRRLEQDQQGQLTAVLNNGLALQLGSSELKTRLERFVWLYQTDLAMRSEQVARVDMRYAQGAAVAFEEPEQLAGLAGQ